MDFSSHSKDDVREQTKRSIKSFKHNKFRLGEGVKTRIKGKNEASDIKT